LLPWDSALFVLWIGYFSSSLSSVSSRSFPCRDFLLFRRRRQQKTKRSKSTGTIDRKTASVLVDFLLELDSRSEVTTPALSAVGSTVVKLLPLEVELPVPKTVVLPVPKTVVLPEPREVLVLVPTEVLEEEPRKVLAVVPKEEVELLSKKEVELLSKKDDENVPVPVPEVDEKNEPEDEEPVVTAVVAALVGAEVLRICEGGSLLRTGLAVGSGLI